MQAQFTDYARCMLRCSCVGVWQDDRVHIIANEQGNCKTPSCVAFTKKERLIGEAALSQVCPHVTNGHSVTSRFFGVVLDAIPVTIVATWFLNEIEGPDLFNDSGAVVPKY